MRFIVRFGLCLVLFIAALASGATGISQAMPAQGVGMSPLSGPLVVPAMARLDNGQQLGAVEEASLDAPGAIAQRELSRTKFEHLNTQQAESAASGTFPALIDTAEDNLPLLGPGARLTGFASANIAALELSGGKHAWVVASSPIAIRGSSGRWTGVDLGLRDVGDAFEAVNPRVNVGIPKHLQEGARLRATGITITAVDAEGAALSGAEGVANGTSVFFANTQTDADTVLKPSSRGLDVTTILRAIASPQTLYFRIGLPEGDRLVTSREGAGIAVVHGHTAVGFIPAPAATDAAGTPVPVRMTLAGSTLVLSVAHREASYRYPIAVDPEFVGITESPEGSAVGNWHFNQGGYYSASAEYGTLSMVHPGQFEAGDYALWQMQAKGDTRIWAVRGDLSGPSGTSNAGWPGIARVYDASWAGAWLDLDVNGTTVERSFREPPNSENYSSLVCANVECTPNGVSADNWAGIDMTTLESSYAVEAQLEKEGYSSSNKFEPTFSASASKVLVYIAQESQIRSEAKFGSAVELEYGGFKTPNVTVNPNVWMTRTSGALEVDSQDPGLGVSEAGVEVDNPPGYEGWTDPYWFGLVDYLKTSSCAGIECSESEHQIYNYETLHSANGPLPQGEITIRPAARSAFEGVTGTGDAQTIKVDSEPPVVTINGLHTEKQPYESGGIKLERTVYTLGEGGARIKAEATDGKEGVASSGVRSIALSIDGREFGSSGGSCVPGPCSASREWTLNGAELGSGMHTLKIIATDYAGNVGTTGFPLAVYHASPIAIGPGSVNPQSGDFAMESTDVNLSGGMGSLVVSRHYDSRNVTEGAEGPLGPQWTLSLGSLAELEVLPDGSVMVIGPQGISHFNTKEGGGFEAPEGDTNLTLEYEPKTPAYIVKDAKQKSTVEFTLPSGAKTWMPTVSQGIVATDQVTDEYRTVEGESPGNVVIQPTLELAPHPAANCSHAALEKLEIAAKGCRALEFVYYNETTATGEAESEWAGYKNRLKEIVAIAYNPTTKAMARTAVAAYRWGKRGWLRKEWDPRISPALPTFYGYDSEGHVTSVSPPAEQPWLLHYGTIPSDPNPGRLLSVSRFPASTALWTGKVLENKKEPSLSSTTAKVGGKAITVEKYKWTTTPTALGVQWQRCNGGGAECVAIPGATDVSYAPVLADAGHTLRAKVFATNASNTASATSPATTPVTNPPKSTATFGSEGSGAGQLVEPSGTAVSANGKDVWVADKGNNRIDEFTTSGTFVEAVGWGVANKQLYLQTCTTTCYKGAEPETLGGSGAGEIAGATAIAINQTTGNLYVSDEEGWVEEFSSSGKYIRRFGGLGSESGKLEYPASVAIEPSGNVWVSDTYDCHVDEFSEAGSLLAVDGECGTGLGQFTKDRKDPITFMGSTLYVSDQGDARVERLTGGTWSSFPLLNEKKEEVDASELTADPVTGDLILGGGELWDVTPEGRTIETFAPENDFDELIMRGALGYSVAGSGAIYDANYRLARIEVWTPEGPTQEPAEPAPEPESTIALTTLEYQVPLSGTGVPQMSPTEVAKWGQIDVPFEATAIFPATEPVGWPATGYKRATILYTDSHSRAVNTATPSGGISTSEYNEANEVTRTLSADNRAIALKEANPVAASELLDTKNTYNKEQELESTLGPQHPVRLAQGKEKPNEETLARNHMRYFYDEGAKEVEEHTHETYALVTKTIDGAETPSHEEFDKRVVTTGYSGQNDLGWELRKPTSTTNDPEGLDLTTVMRYEKGTGNLIETQTPGSSPHGSGSLVFLAQFGKVGKEPGQLKEPRGVAIANGIVYVLDSENSRVEEFSEAGNYLGTFGSAGKEPGQLKSPSAITIGPNGDIYIADTGNDNIVVYNAKKEYVTQFGAEGTGNGQLEEPRGIAVTGTGTIFVADTGNHRVDKFSEKDEFVSMFGGGVRSGEAHYEVCKAEEKIKCRVGVVGIAEGMYSAPNDIAISGSTLYVVDTGNQRVDRENEEGRLEGVLGGPKSKVPTGGFEEPRGVAIDAEGHVWVSDGKLDILQEFKSGGEYLASVGTKGSEAGQFTEPWGLAFASNRELYVADAKNNRIERWAPGYVSGNPEAHDMRTVYYNAKGEGWQDETEVAACQEHIEWVGLPCETVPAAQPGIANKPELPTTTFTYDMWEQVETTSEAFGAATRTRTTTFDPAGRPLTTEEKEEANKSEVTNIAIPKITDKYNTENGSLEKQSIPVGTETKTITATVNTLGQTSAYTDAEGNKATYAYEAEGPGRLTKLTDAKGDQTFKYNTTTGELSELTDSGAGTFSVLRDVEGHILSQTLPGGITEYTTYNQTGAAVKLEYKKETHCGEKCVWYSDSIVPSIHGETLKQTSTFSEEPTYEYDPLGRLTEAQEIPTGEGCKTRLYTYEEESNRTSLTSRAPAAEGKCASEGGSSEFHTYDTANEMTDPGIAYDPFGDITVLPAADAGGQELVSSFYVDGQVATQSQDKKTIEYALDPDGRTRQTISAGNTAVEHYDGPGGTVAWTSEPSEAWTRNVVGIGGMLDATQKGHGTTAETAVLLLHDLQGDVIGTVEDSETATGIQNKYNSSEFGVPSTSEAPPKYGWLGAAGLSSELVSGTITQDGITYVPQTGRPLQTQAVNMPSPVFEGTPYVSQLSAWVLEQGIGAAAQQLARAEEARRELESSAACDEETEGCGPDPSHGPNPWSCGVWVSWGTGTHIGGDLEVYGHWACGIAPPDIEIEIALLKSLGNGHFKLVPGDTKTRVFVYPGELGPVQGPVVSEEWECVANKWYQAWVWGRTWNVWNNQTNWYATAEDGHQEQCEPGVEDPTPPIEK